MAEDGGDVGLGGGGEVVLGDCGDGGVAEDAPGEGWGGGEEEGEEEEEGGEGVHCCGLMGRDRWELLWIDGEEIDGNWKDRRW